MQRPTKQQTTNNYPIFIEPLQIFVGPIGLYEIWRSATRPQAVVMTTLPRHPSPDHGSTSASGSRVNMYCLYTVLYRIVCTLYCTVLYCTVLYTTVLYCTVLYCTVLYCTVIVVHCTLHCTALILFRLYISQHVHQRWKS